MIDYAIIGAGISGVFSAWRLKAAYPDKNVVLFEYSNRIGGRLLTVQLPNMSAVNAELGGMRYISTEHTLMDKVVKEMGLSIRNFPMGGSGDPTGNNNFAYFREKHMKIGQLKDSAEVPYKLDWAEQNVMPDTLQANVLKLLIPDHDEFTNEDWFEVEVLGKPLWQWGLWNLLYKMLSPEGYRFIQQGSGYDTNVSNGNAVALLPTGSDYTGTTSYCTPEKGMQAIPLSLCAAFEELGGSVQLNQRLVSIKRQSNEKYSLAFNATKTVIGDTTDVLPIEESVHETENVVLAMPRHSLESIQWDQWKLDSFLRINVKSVLMQSAFKLVLGYDMPWWRSLGLEAGRSITDLPIRQTLYFGSEGQISPMINRSLLMASYNDMSTVPFWKGLERGASFGHEPVDYLATDCLVDEAHAQVSELHGQRDLPRPYAAAYMDWSKAPFGAAWHMWKPGFKYNTIIPKMRHPVPHDNVFICGEAYSNDQGWAEGALESAEEMLTQDLGVLPHRCTEDWAPDRLRRKRY